ncbi:unnamed protein product [Cuscuta campestris]|uniref:WD repeat-containing protein 76 n=1 Tax=Cuscuta campestris TaxID=132261 RepID=A0A484KB06_9ASTE|nr:unnamed protein product [Cuscuta campestris]
MAASRKLTDYERLRLENIRRNQEKLAALNIQSRLSPAAKRPRVQNKSYKLSPEKKLKFESPIVLRRSLRTRGKPPDSSTSGGLKDDFDESKSENKLGPQFSLAKLRKEPVPLNMKDAFCGENYGPNQQLIETIKSLSRKEQLDENADQELIVCEQEKKRIPPCSIDIDSLRLEPENMARVVPGRILNVKFIPTAGMRMVVAGNKYGNIGFWNADAKEDEDGIYLYQPHSSPVSGILIDSFSQSKMFTSCYDGFIRLMDINKELFDSIYLSDYSIYALFQRPDNSNSLYYAEGGGYLGIWDLRAGKSSSSWKLHEDRINSIDFNMENSNTMATSSTDRTVCVWDMRNAGSHKPKPLRTIHHERAVHSAYFSRSGQHLASTSFDDKIGLSSGANYEDVSMIHHDNQTGRWLSSFRGIWGWDDSYIFIGNMKRGVDIISTHEKTIVKTLQSELVSAIQCRFDTHPYNVGMVAGATSGGQVYLWGTS